MIGIHKNHIKSMWGPPNHQESARISISEFVTTPGRKNHESSRRPSETRVENFFLDRPEESFESVIDVKNEPGR